MRLLLGRQIVLKEFYHTDLAISWIEEPVAGAYTYLIGNDKGYMYVVANSDEIHYGSDFDHLNTPFGKVSIICSSKPIGWELIHSSKKSDALLVVVFQRAANISELLLTKAICWGASKEFNIPVALLVNHLDHLQYELCVPRQGKEQSGMVYDSSASCIIDMDVSKTETGVFFTVRSFAEG
ncbi:MAG: hypothetical protein ACK4E2_05050 [Pseudothermotoga sp.]